MRHSLLQRLLASLLILMLSCNPLLAEGEFDISHSIPDIGSSADAVLSLSEEQELGEAFMRNIRRTAPLIEDPEVETYIQNLGQHLVSYLESAPYDFTFFVLNAREINAFAVPGGYIGIHAGLITAADNENELASVVAHEIAHISQRHISRSFEKSQNVSLLTMATIMAAILLAGDSGDASMAALSTGMAASYQTQLNFTRAHEKEADRIGIQLLAAANYDPRGMPHFFEKLHQESRYRTSGMPEILQTHPVTINRISEATSRAENYPMRGEVDQPEFQLIKQKIAVLATQQPHTLAQQYQAQLETQSKNPALNYGYALILTRNGKYPEAEAILSKLIKHDSKRTAYQIALADLYGLEGKSTQALSLLEKELALHPGNKPLTMTYAEQLIKANQSGKAVKLLENHMRYNTSTPSVYQLRAQAEDAAGNKAASHAALAELAYLRDQTNLAIQHLETAIKAAQENKLLLPVLQSRIEQLKEIALKEREKQ
jgi:predicted Zn-dependent protease